MCIQEYVKYLANTDKAEHFKYNYWPLSVTKMHIPSPCFNISEIFRSLRDAEGEGARQQLCCVVIACVCTAPLGKIRRHQHQNLQKRVLAAGRKSQGHSGRFLGNAVVSPVLFLAQRIVWSEKHCDWWLLVRKWAGVWMWGFKKP